MSPAAPGGGGAPLAALTGGTGFLGRYIALALAEGGWRLRLLVRGDPAHPQTAALDPEFVSGSLDDASALERLCCGADVVVHAAGLIKARDRAAFHAVNEAGTARLAAAAGETRLVVVSSLAAREPGLSDYAASKCAGEAAARDAARGPVTVLRPPVLYGPWDRETLALFRLAEGAFLPLPRAPEARLCFLHAADAAAAVAAFAGSASGDGTFELSDQRTAGYSWTEIARTAARAVGGRPRLVPVPRAAWHAAGAASEAAARLAGRPAMLTRGKVREILHPDWSVDPVRRPPAGIWRPRIDLERGFGLTACWYRRRGWLAVGGCVETAAHGSPDDDRRCE